MVVGGPTIQACSAGGRTFEDAEAPPEMVQKRDRIAAVCKRHGVDIRAAALSSAPHIRLWPVIPGAKRPEEGDRQCTTGAASNPRRFLERAQEEGLLPQEAPVPL